MTKSALALGALIVLSIAAWFAFVREDAAAPIVDRDLAAAETTKSEPRSVRGEPEEAPIAQASRSEVVSTPEQAAGTDDQAGGVRVRVLDSRGNPAAGVPVGIAFVAKAQTISRVRRATDALGNVSFREDELKDDRKDVERVIAYAHAPLAPLPMAEFAIGERQGDVIELRLPAYGSVRVRFDDMGSGFSAKAAIMKFRDSSTDRLPDWVSLTANFEDGEAVFPVVGLDRDFGVSLRVPGCGVWPEQDFEGPRFDGQEVVVLLGLTSKGTLAVFRVLDESDQVFRSRGLELRLESESPHGSSSSFLSLIPDAKGRVGVLLEPQDPPPTKTTLLVREPEKVVEASFLFPTTLREGVVDFGDLQLRGAPVLIEGRVVDPQGQAIEEARVSLPMHDFATKSAPDGTFVLRGSIDAATFDLSVQKIGYLPAGVRQASVGSRGVEVRMARGARIEGRITTAREGIHANFVIGLRARTESSLRREVVVLGPYTIESIPPGTYDVGLYLMGQAEPLRHWPGMELVGGETLTLPSVEVDSLVRIVKLRLIGPAGEAIDHARVLIKQRIDSGDQPTFEGVLSRQDVATIILPLTPVEVGVIARGYVPVTLVPTREEEDVTLEHFPRLRVTPSHPIELPPGTWIEVQVSSAEERLPRGKYTFRGQGGTTSSNGSSPESSLATAKLDTRGNGECTIPGFGRHHVRAVLHTSTGADDRKIPLDSAIETDLLVNPGTPSVTRVLNLDAATLSSLLEGKR